MVKNVVYQNIFVSFKNFKDVFFVDILSKKL